MSMMNFLSEGILNKMKEMEGKMEEMNTTHDATKQMMNISFTDTEKSLEAAHIFNKDQFRMLEEDLKEVKKAIKE
eukprot:3155224-Heterocapsa_arctica.AAC.1